MSSSSHFSPPFVALNLRKDMQGYKTRELHFHIATTACLRIEWYRKEGYFLNPEFYCPNAQQHINVIDTELRVGLRQVLKKLLGVDDQINALQEVSTYTQRRGGFADPLAIRAIGKMPPADWWMNFGDDTPYLRKTAVRMLSQVTTSSNCERNWSTFSLIHTKSRNRLTMQKLNKLVYCHYNLKLRNRTRERKARDSPSYCLISLDHIFRDDDPLLQWIVEIEDLLLDSDPGFQEEVRDLLDEEMDDAEGAPLEGEGTSAQPHPQSRGKEPAYVVSSSEKTSTTVSSSSHGGGDGRDGAGDTSGTGATSEYYQHDQEDVIPVEEVQDFPERMEGNRGYQRRRRVSPPAPGGSNNEQGNMGEDVGGQQAASWADSWNPSYSGQGPSHYFPYGQLQQGDEQSSILGSYLYSDYGETQYNRYPPPPPPAPSYDDAATTFFGLVDPNFYQYQMQYSANTNDNTDMDEDKILVDIPFGGNSDSMQERCSQHEEKMDAE